MRSLQRAFRRLCPVMLAIAALMPAPAQAAASAPSNWVPAYLSSPCAPIVGVPAEVIPPPQEIQGTVRYRITMGAGGRSMVLRLSNEVGTKPLRVGHVTIRIARGRPDKFINATFAGNVSTVIPAGAPMLSDPIALPVMTGDDILVSVHFPEPFTHTQADGLRPTQYSGGADQAEAMALSVPRDLFVRPIISGVFALSDTHREAIVTMGDSITDGTGAQSTEVRSWPERLGARLAKMPRNKAVVANAGISGNKLLADGWGISALARLDRDVLAMPSVRHIILLEGINDIGSAGVDPDAEPGAGPSVKQLLGAYRQLIGRAHVQKVRVVCATILPMGGSMYFSEAKERKRSQVNGWIRTSGECDGVIDFD